MEIIEMELLVNKYGDDAQMVDIENIQDYFSSAQVNYSKKISRNSPCPCNSGLKYKKCCGKN
jgi:preprotein translocase subunit SecA